MIPKNSAISMPQYSYIWIGYELPCFKNANGTRDEKLGVIIVWWLHSMRLQPLALDSGTYEQYSDVKMYRLKIQATSMRQYSRGQLLQESLGRMTSGNCHQCTVFSQSLFAGIDIFCTSNKSPPTTCRLRYRPIYWYMSTTCAWIGNIAWTLQNHQRCYWCYFSSLVKFRQVLIVIQTVIWRITHFNLKFW